MDTSTLVPPGETTPADSPSRSTSAPARPDTSRAGLGAEVRESLMLLGFATAVTVGLTAAAQAALVLLS